MMSADRQSLITQLAERGVIRTARQIDRLCAEAAIPRPIAKGRGRARGVRRVWPSETIERILALVRYQNENRSLKICAFRLWLDGYEVPLAKIRATLSASLPKNRVRDSESARAECVRLAETILRRKRMPSRLTKLAKEGELQLLFEALLGVALGEQNPDPARVIDLFEKATGLDRARSDALPGVSPWLQSEGVDALAIAFDYVKKLAEAIGSATDEELYFARQAYQGFAKLFTFAEVAQTTYGPNAFGFAALSDPCLGMSTNRHVMTFAAMLILTRLHAPLMENLPELAQTAERAARELREAACAARSPVIVQERPLDPR